MSIYKEEMPSRNGRESTFPDSNDFIIEAMAPGDDIFDKTGEIPVVPWRLEAARKKGHLPGHLFPPRDHLRAEYIERARYNRPFPLGLRSKELTMRNLS